MCTCDFLKKIINGIAFNTFFQICHYSQYHIQHAYATNATNNRMMIEDYYFSSFAQSFAMRIEKQISAVSVFLNKNLF